MRPRTSCTYGNSSRSFASPHLCRCSDFAKQLMDVQPRIAMCVPVSPLHTHLRPRSVAIHTCVASHTSALAHPLALCFTLRCIDDHQGCSGWADSGECTSNPKFMHAHCAVSCKSCGKPLDQLDPDEDHYGDWRCESHLNCCPHALRGSSLPL